MRFRLTPMDEWPRHQIGATFDVVANPSPHWSDGYYFTTGAGDGSVTLFAGLRLYANNDVMDAFACVTCGGHQHNLRLSRRLRPAIDHLGVGPLRVEIVEPMRRLRTVCEGDPSGLAFDLTWEAVAEPYNEDHVQMFVNGLLVADRCNYDQAHDVQGWVEVGGAHVTVDGWTGVRDHSWGVGPTGGARSDAAAPPPRAEVGSRPFGLRQWHVVRFPTRVLFLQYHRRADGSLSMFESRSLPRLGYHGEAWSYTGVTEELVFATGEDGSPLRRLAHATLHLARPDGGTDRIGVERVSAPVYLEGGGYWAGFDDARGRGVYRGDDHREADVWDVTHPTLVTTLDGSVVSVRRDVWAESWGRYRNLDDPAETGTGHLECVVSGRYPGFEEAGR